MSSTRGKRVEMLPPLERHEIQVLRRAGDSQSEVARLANVSPRTVRRVDAKSEIVDADARKQVKQRGVGRPSKVEPLREFVTDVLAKAHGEDRLRNAIASALEREVFGAEYVARLLGEQPARELSLIRGGASTKRAGR